MLGTAPAQLRIQQRGPRHYVVASDRQAALICFFLDRAFSIHAPTDRQTFCTMRHGSGPAQERLVFQHDGTVILQGDWRRTAERLARLVEPSPADAEMFDGYREVLV